MALIGMARSISVSLLVTLAASCDTLFSGSIGDFLEFYINTEGAFLFTRLLRRNNSKRSLSTPMGVDNVVIGFDMEVQPTMQLDLYA